MRREKMGLREARHLLVGDSMERERMMKRLIELVRADERAKTLDALGRARDKASNEPG
jgi:hypothetical protein